MGVKTEMKCWWCAIDTENSSYEELKHRKVIAQGWPGTGSLESVLALVPRHQDVFESIVQQLGDVAYGDSEIWSKQREPSAVPRVFWNLLGIDRGDVVVALEGRSIRGLSIIQNPARECYRYRSEYEYGHEIAYPVEWVDASEIEGIAEVIPPAQSVQGVRGLEKQGDLVRWLVKGVAVRTGSDDSARRDGSAGKVESRLRAILQVYEGSDSLFTIIRHQRNWVDSLDGDIILVSTEDKGERRPPEPVSFGDLCGAYLALLKSGYLTEEGIKGRLHFRSAFVLAILSRLPGVRVDEGRRRLIYMK